MSCGDNTYGGTFRLFDRVLEHFGLRFTFVDTARSAARRRRDQSKDSRGAGRDSDQPVDAA